MRDTKFLRVRLGATLFVLLSSGVAIAAGQCDSASCLSAGCEAKRAGDCAALALLRSKGQGVKKDLKGAFVLYDKACGLGDARACGSVADAYLLGTGVKKDVAKATALYRQQCKDRNAGSCFALGHRLLAGEGAPKSEAQAAQAWKLGCELGANSACYELGKLLLADKKEQGMALIDRACKAGYKKACEPIQVAGKSAGRKGGGSGSSEAKCSTDLMNDRKNCGQCGFVCPEACLRGSCVSYEYKGEQ